MSSLIFEITEGSVFVAVDTLATDLEGVPVLLQSKATPVLHLDLLVAGTGVGGFHNDWALEVSSRFRVAGIDNLDFHTTNRLRSIWADYLTRGEAPDGATTTIYHLGFSEHTGLGCGYVYRSENDFISERMGAGLCFKPECNPPEGCEIDDLVQSMMLEQRAIQEGRPLTERVHVGGECILYFMQPGMIVSKRLCKFQDYDEPLSRILETG